MPKEGLTLSGENVQMKIWEDGRRDTQKVPGTSRAFAGPLSPPSQPLNQRPRDVSHGSPNLSPLL